MKVRGQKMTNEYDQMLHYLEFVSKVNRKYTLPFIQKKTGLNIVNKGEDHGMIVTSADLNVSKALLDGFEGSEGFRDVYPGSFSEEDDSKTRQYCYDIIQVDPIDGTGDMVDSYKGKKITGPTTLISKLGRNGLHDYFSPKAGLIFDIVHEIGLISDGVNVGLYKINVEGKVEDVKYELTRPTWKYGDKVRINRRISYPQLTYDGAFMDYLRSNKIDVEIVPVGGAGIFAMQVFRNYIQPTSDNGKDFADLEKIDIGFNAQPDWKTWDTNPTDVIADALKMPERKDIFGRPLTANAALSSLKEMHHTTGYVLSTSNFLRDLIIGAANEFTARNPDCSLLKKDYEYKTHILSR